MVDKQGFVSMRNAEVHIYPKHGDARAYGIDAKLLEKCNGKYFNTSLHSLIVL